MIVIEGGITIGLGITIGGGLLDEIEFVTGADDLLASEGGLDFALEQ